MDLTAVGASLASLLVGLGTGFKLWQRRAAEAARLQVEVAQSGAQRTIADAEHTLYNLLVKRLADIEGDVKGLRAELADERRRGRELETHIYHLENLMRAAGMDPPVRAQMLG